jgi:hypothetical protein
MYCFVSIYSKIFLNLIRIIFKLKRITIIVFKSVINEQHFTLFSEWEDNDFQVPAPHFIKQKIVVRNVIRNSTIIESGTHLGDTTKKLSKLSSKVISIEPDSELFLKASKRFSNNSNIKILNGTSEQILPDLLKSISGDVSFWLDGHFSGDGTFKGQLDSPIKIELFEIQKNLNDFDRICVLVDDVRCFNPKLPAYSDYPPVDFLINWANTNNFAWSIENDIFIAKNY